MFKKLIHVILLSCTVLAASSTPIKANKPTISIEYENPKMDFSVTFMDELLKKVTWPSTVAGFRALTQIGLGGYCAYVGVYLLRTGVDTFAKSFQPEAPDRSVGTAPRPSRTSTIPYFVGGLTLTGAGLFLICKKYILNPDQASATQE